MIVVREFEPPRAIRGQLEVWLPDRGVQVDLDTTAVEEVLGYLPPELAHRDEEAEQRRAQRP